MLEGYYLLNDEAAGRILNSKHLWQITMLAA